MSWSSGNYSLREFEWNNFIAATPDCAGAEPNDAFGCLRNASINTLIQSFNAVEAESPEAPYAFGPCVDGYTGLIPDHPFTLLSDGHFSKVPFIAGTNKDEGE